MLDCTDHNKLRLRRVSSQLCFSGETKAGPTVQDLYDSILYGYMMYIHKYVRCFTVQKRQKLLDGWQHRGCQHPFGAWMSEPAVDVGMRSQMGH